MLVKVKVLGKAKRGKCVTNKGLATKLVQDQPNTMEAKFAQLKALITSMVAQVKSITFGSKKAKD
jgi:hypothetical protein